MRIANARIWWLVYRGLALTVLVIAIWMPRALALDRFATVDERIWLTRAANFYCALSQHDFAHTVQSRHPGVTTMWAGAAGFAWRASEYRNGCQAQVDSDKHESILRERGLEPIRLLAASRFFIVLLNTGALVLGFVFACRVLGFASAFVGFALIAFDPFHIAHTRLLHLDGLLSSLMLLGVLAFTSYLRQRRLLDLVVSGVAAGLSWLTKSPGVLLVPFVGLSALMDLWNGSLGHKKGGYRTSDRLAGTLWRFVWPLLLWGTIGIAVFMLLWPAMWVDPLAILGRMFAVAGIYASGGHGNPVFYNGTLVRDGRLGVSYYHFYPITFLWRSTPIVLFGLVGAALTFAAKHEPFDERTENTRRIQTIRQRIRRTVVEWALFSVIFTAVLTLSTKKFDRYLLPVYGPLDLLAGVGWVAVTKWLMRRFAVLPQKLGTALILSGAVTVQLVLVLPTFPYYLSYYNPLLGGGRKASEVMSIGWGEGLDQAARYLNEKPNAQDLHVLAWYCPGSFSYFFKGVGRPMPNQSWRDVHLQELLNLDYAVVYYTHQMQRQAPKPLLDYLEPLAPERSIWINGIEYVRIYNMENDIYADPTYVHTDVLLGDRVLLEGFVVPVREFLPGEILTVSFSWRASDALDERLKVFVQLLNEAGVLVAQNDAEPVAWLRPTDTWLPGEQIVDRHGVQLPPDLSPGEYTLIAGMYRLSGERLAVIQAGRSLGNAYPLGQITIRRK